LNLKQPSAFLNVVKRGGIDTLGGKTWDRIPSLVIPIRNISCFP